MRVVIVTTYYPNSCDPVRAIFIKHLSEELSKYSNVDIVSPVAYVPFLSRSDKNNCLSNIQKETNSGNINIFYPRFMVIPGLEFLNGLMFSTSIYGIIKKLKKAHSDEKIIIHSHCIYPDGFGSGVVSQILKLPYVLTSHGSDINVLPERALLKPQIKYALKHANGVIAVSRLLVDKIKKLVGAGSINPEYIPCAGFFPDVFMPDLSRSYVHEDGVEIVFIGNLVKIKALDVLLRAWRKVMDTDSAASYHLTIIGEGPEKSNLIDQAVNLGIESTVRFMGRIEYVDIYQHILNSDFLCLPSYNEGTPNVVIEALACGVPVVGSAVGAIPELLADNNGIVVPPGDADALAQAIIDAPTMLWDRKKIAASVTDYEWEKLGARNSKYLEQVCNDFYS